jgi:hypothetical protein
MEQYIIGIVFIICTIIVVVWEIVDRKKIPDLPDCAYISNYCTPYGDKQNIKYVIKEPTNKESIESLLSKIETNRCKYSKLVYWRISLIISLVTCTFIWMFNKLEGTNIKAHTYLYILVVSLFLNYWMRNHLDFHYHDHMCVAIKESVKQLRSKLLKN